MTRRVATGGKGGEASSARFQTLGKIALILRKKCLGCGHLWVKFII